MVSHTIQILMRHINDPHMGGAISEAIQFLSSSNIEKQEGPTGSGQRSKSVADIQAFRKRSGYYKANAVKGLDETIKSLKNCDAVVWSRVIETDKGYVAIWLDDSESPRGVLIFTKNTT